MLVGVMIFFTLVVMWCEHHFKDDAQIFQLFATVISGASGALFMKLKGAQGASAPPPGIHSTTTTVTAKSETQEPAQDA